LLVNSGTASVVIPAALAVEIASVRASNQRTIR
jgi:hypothetical protein